MGASGVSMAAVSCARRERASVIRWRSEISLHMSKPLVIVESPAKAKTLGRFLGDRYRVEASYGHIRDLPESAAEVPKDIKDKEWGRLGVDVDSDFTPYYVVPDDKKKQVAHLKTAVKDASELLLATDPDREGESISWHLAQVLKPKVPVRRIVFHEITEDAVKEALAHPSDVNENLVRAQESRRILDRLYGYTLSPVLWKKVQTGLSAGRVQSVAVRLIVEREEERRAFRTGVYWDLEATLKGEGRAFVATLVRINDQRVATGKDFDPQTGRLKNANVRLLDEAATGALAKAMRWQSAMDRHLRGAEAGRGTSRTTVHHVDIDPGSEPQVGVRHRAHDAGGSAAFPGARACRQRTGAHYLSSNRFHDAFREGAGRIRSRHRRDLRGRVPRRTTPVSDSCEERAGGSRGDSAYRLQGDAEPARRDARFRRAQDLRADLEADDGLADGGCARTPDDARDFGERRER